jgi:uncharacterized membrane protein YczE
MKTLKKKWLLYSVTGILIMGFGLSVMGEALIAKAMGQTFLNLVFDWNSRIGFDLCWIVGFWSGYCLQKHYGSK